MAKYVNVRIDDELHAAVAAQAESEGRTKAGLIRMATMRYLEMVERTKEMALTDNPNLSRPTAG